MAEESLFLPTHFRSRTIGMTTISSGCGGSCLRMLRQQDYFWVMISRISSAKSGSNTGDSLVSSSCAFAKAMHSEILRCNGSAGWTTASGWESSSMTISSPGPRRANNVANRLAASSSEIWMTCFAIINDYKVKGLTKPSRSSTPPTLPEA